MSKTLETLLLAFRIKKEKALESIKNPQNRMINLLF
jgi:hypothetical protein